MWIMARCGCPGLGKDPTTFNLFAVGQGKRFLYALLFWGIIPFVGNILTDLSGLDRLRRLCRLGACYFRGLRCLRLGTFYDKAGKGIPALLKLINFLVNGNDLVG